MCGVAEKHNMSKFGNSTVLSSIINEDIRFFETSGSNKNIMKIKTFPQTQDVSMKILNLIKNENYYTNIEEDFQTKLKGRIYDYDKISKKLKISVTTLKRITDNKNYWIKIDTLLKLALLLGIDEKRIVTKMNKIKTKNSFPIGFKNLKISEGFMRIIGHLLGDGGIHVKENEGKYRAFYVNNEKTLLNFFIADIKNIFGPVKFYKRSRVLHGDEIWLPTTVGYIFYNILDYSKNAKQKRIPDFIFSLDIDLICALLQAIYDDEGYLYPQKYMIAIFQKSKPLLEDIHRLLIKIGIAPNKILLHDSQTRTKMWYFSITSKKNILKFNEKIGFKHPIKKKKLEILTRKYRE